jgi:hypothetical protein
MFSLAFLGYFDLSYAQYNLPFILPFEANPPYAITSSDSPVNDYKGQANSASETTCSSSGLTDRFDSRYYLGEGKTSPNGKWENVYSGYGSTGVQKSGSKNVFYLSPKVVTSADQTEAALVKSKGTFCNYSVEFDINTVKQLRQGSPPNTWEAGWHIFRYTDTFHYYWFLVRTDGIELGKKDCDTCTDSFVGQQFLVTKDLPLLKTNKWQHWKIEAIDNHIKVWVNNKLVIDYIDKTMSPKLASGNIAMYSEDAHVQYDNMVLTSK